MKGKPVLICLFIRPPGSVCEPLSCLREPISIIIYKEGQPCFNPPEICLEDGFGCIKTNPGNIAMHGYEINNLFLLILNDIVLEQQVKEPTRSICIYLIWSCLHSPNSFLVFQLYLRIVYV